MSDIGDSQFHKGQAVWVLGDEDEQRAAEYVGEAELGTWFGGPARVIVVYLDSKMGEAVDVYRVVPREAEEA